jgi:Flp pilus assembly protein TadB
MSILYSILGLVALGLFSVIVLPIMVVVFLVGVAGLVARFGRRKMSKEFSPEFRRAFLQESRSSW